MSRLRKIYLFLFPSYNKGKRNGNGNEEKMEQILIIDRNAVYELDEECFQRKMEAQRKQQEERANAQENDKEDI